MKVELKPTPVTHSRPVVLGLVGKSDSGKTYTALKFAKLIGGRWVMIDSDNKRSLDYVEEFGTDKWLDSVFLSDPAKRDPAAYISAIETVEAAKGKYTGVIVDGLTAFWQGILDIHASRAEELAKKWWKNPEMADKATIQAWAGPEGGNAPFYKLLTKIAEFPIHCICTFRAKMAFDNSSGALKPTGDWIPHFRSGEHMYEFSLYGWMEKLKDGRRRLIFEKDANCRALRTPKGSPREFDNPGEEVVKILKRWRNF